MELRSLGNTGVQVSALGFGCGAVGGLMVVGDPAEQRQAVARALDAGITYFDTASSYGSGRSEENLGRVMADLGTWPKVTVGTKVRLRREEFANPQAAIRGSIEESLGRLGRSDVDILHLHNPVGRSGDLDLETTLDEVADGLRQVVAAGLARQAGFTGLGDTDAVRQVVQAEPFHTVQTYFNALNPSAGFSGRRLAGQQDFEGLIDTAAGAGRGVIVIRVLAAGAAAAQPARATNAGDPGGGLVGGGAYADDLASAERLVVLAAELGLDGPVELSIRFGLSKPGVSTVLVGYSNQAHLEEAIRFAERGPLSSDAVEDVLALTEL